MFLHGYPLNGFQWWSVIDRLSAHRRCIAPDFIGLGYTEAPLTQDVSPQAQADMIIAFLDALELPAIDIVASDSGGTVAQILAAQNFTRVRSLLLANCYAPARMVWGTAAPAFGVEWAYWLDKTLPNSRGPSRRRCESVLSRRAARSNC